MTTRALHWGSEVAGSLTRLEFFVSKVKASNLESAIIGYVLVQSIGKYGTGKSDAGIVECEVCGL